MAKSRKNKNKSKQPKVKLDPNKTARIANEALEQARSGDPEMAYRMLGKALERAPRHGGILLNLGILCVTLEKYGEAEDFFARTLRVDPNYQGQILKMAGDHESAGRTAASLSCLGALSSVFADHAAVQCIYGALNASLGKQEEAIALLEKSLQIDPLMAKAYYYLSRLRPLQQLELEQLQSLAGSSTSDESRRFVDYALGLQQHYSGNYPQAVEHWKKAGEVIPANFPTTPQTAISDTNGHIALLLELFSNYRSYDLPAAATAQCEVYILVGMPCSGVFSLGHALSKADNTIYAGANPWFNQTIGKMLQQCAGDFRQVVQKLDEAALLHLRSEFLHSLNPHQKEGVRIVDANSYDFLNLWLVAMIMPEAKIIHCIREETENTVSILATDEFFQPYTRDLGCIREYHKSQQRLMAFWKDTLPISIEEWQVGGALPDCLSGFTSAVTEVPLAFNECPQVSGHAENYRPLCADLTDFSLNFNGFDGGLPSASDEPPSIGGEGLKLNF